MDIITLLILVGAVLAFFMVIGLSWPAFIAAPPVKPAW